jgi:hypothetical protein
MGLRLMVLPEILAVCRLAADAEVPGWGATGGFSSITRTGEELSIVAEQAHVPAGVRAEGGWRALKVAGPIPFEAVGVLAGVAAPLARAGISLFALSTFDTDYVLVKGDRLEAARAALIGAGHEVA